MSNFFLKKVQQYSFHKEILKRGDRIVVAISGGPDSTALACFLNQLKKKQNFQLKLVHVNYHQRGAESDGDEKFVFDFAEKNKMDLEIFHYKKGKSKNLEEDMRNFRYDILEKVRAASDFNRIAIGHTKDDQVETFLMNLIRGSGVNGLVSLREKRNYIIRPFLCSEKNEILNFLKIIKQEFRTDSSNYDENFSRNRIRRELIPLLEKKYNKNIKNAVINLIEHLRDDLAIIEDIEKKVYNKKVDKKSNFIVINEADLIKMPIGIRKRIFRKIVSDISGSVKNITSANFFEFNKFLKSNKSKNSSIKIGNIDITKKKKEVFFKSINKSKLIK